MRRRDFMRQCGLLTAGAAFAGPLASATEILGADESLNKLKLPIRALKAQTGRQITVVIIGAGGRGNVYSSYAELFPESVKIVGVSDILDYRCKNLSDKHNVPQENRFGHFREVFARPKFADAVVIATPDDRHYEPCMKALELGYDVLLEKPVAPTEKECRDILAMSRKTGRIVAVCHVLRYSPYFIALREVIKKGTIGELVSVQHFEPIAYSHMAHSYVRGNWRSSKETTPIILAKSCHDLDILRWIVDKPCKNISAEGSLHLFKAEMAPEGAPLRCTDGCPHEDRCPYSAINIYARKKEYLYVFDDMKDRYDSAAMIERLKTSPYGRCVYHCDNDQPDHYVTTMTFEGDKTASFSMEAFTPWGGRRTRIMGTEGYIEGDMKEFTVWDFRSGKKKVWNMNVDELQDYKGHGHGGGDLALMRDFVEAVAAQDAGKLSSTIEVSLESHLMGFAAEKSRKSGKKYKVQI